MTRNELIGLLGLEPHPEGGWYRQTWRAEEVGGRRASGSAIFYLLTATDISRRHRVDAAETWHYYRGAPVEIRSESSDGSQRLVLGPEVELGQMPQLTIPAGDWQEARSLGAFSLVGCTVSPAFEFSGFELADDALGD